MSNISQDIWYLGIDFGTTGLSAVLLNSSTGDRFQIYWKTGNQIDSTEPSFQLPATAYCGSDGSDLNQSPIASVAIGSLAVTLANNPSGILIENFKPYLNICIPYYYPQSNSWEPVLQYSAQQTVPLYWVQRALQALLATLTPLSQSSVVCGAVGRSQADFSSLLGNLQGVILGNPVGWGDTYRFNLREAVLTTRLVKQPEQIFFIEDTIAAFLAVLPTKNSASNSTTQNSVQGHTLVINAGATATELALVDVPENLLDLTHSHFIYKSFLYGGNAINQDIICQIFWQDELGKMRNELIPPSSLALHPAFELPVVGEPDAEKRDRLQQLLQSSSLGKALLEAAESLKLSQGEFTCNLGTQKLLVTRRELENRVILPVVARLNRELNELLIQTGTPEQVIRQVVCTGGTAFWAAITQWLKQKFPIANFKSSFWEAENVESNQNFSLVAFGLAALPLYPQILERSQHQYSDYFLLWELVRIFSDELRPTFKETLQTARWDSTYSAKEITQMLERRGINTRSCYQRLVAFLEGQLPPDLVPSPATNWLTEASRQNLDYQAIASAPLFFKEDNQIYRPNFEQFQRLRRYLNTLLSGTCQKLEEPLIVDLGI